MSTSQQSAPASAQILELLTGKWVSSAISAAAELGVADHLVAGERNVEELAKLTSSHAPSLYRLLRALASLGIFRETSAHTFTLTPLAECLRGDSPDSVRTLARFFAMPAMWSAWGEIVHCVKTGETGLQKAFGSPNPFEYLKDHPEQAAIFDGAMTDLTRLNAPAIAQAYNFGKFRRLVDIAGGHGHLLGTILHRYTNLHGVLFDLPQVIERARQTTGHLPADRCEMVAGSFFDQVPEGADGYLMQHIIHDWDDQRSVEILRNIRRAMDPAGRVLIVENVIPEGNAPSFGKLMDLEMLMAPGGRERTEAEYRDLFAASGFRLQQIHATYAPQSILEGVPA
jgi:SAM-dependent methyltransferase